MTPQNTSELIQLSSVDFDETHSVLREMPFYEHPCVKVMSSVTVPGQEALIAQEDIAAHTLIFTYTNTLSEIRTRTSIQVSAKHHLEAGDFGSFTNHSCEPNAVIRAELSECGREATAGLISIKSIKAGTEITFDYATTENDLTPALQSVPCLCQSPRCRGAVKHFLQLSAVERDVLVANKLVAFHLAN